MSIKEIILEKIKPKNAFQEQFLKNSIRVLNNIEIRTFEQQFRRTTRLSYNAKHSYYGLAYPDSNLILIDQNLLDSDKLLTVIVHECNHVLNYKKFKFSAYKLEYFAHCAEYMFNNQTKKINHDIIKKQVKENYNLKEVPITDIDLQNVIF